MSKIFKGNPNTFEKTAFLNWRVYQDDEIGNILSLAEGFLNSSINLLKLCVSNNEDNKADMLIFPILTNLNHGMELYLKALIWTLNKLNKSEEKFSKTHNLKTLINESLKKIKETEGDDSFKHFSQSTTELQSYISELYEKINTDGKSDNIDFSRYPITKKMKNHFYVAEKENVEIDLVHLLNVTEKILESLDDRVSYFFYDKLVDEIE